MGTLLMISLDISRKRHKSNQNSRLNNNETADLLSHNMFAGIPITFR